MSLLAIDTSSRAMGLALYDGLSVLYEAVWHSVDFHTVELAPAIQGALHLGGQTMDDLEVLGVAIGPGSYTGLRIGLSLAKGLAFARRIPLVTIPTLDILAAGQHPADIPLACILQAGRSRIAVGWYAAKEDRWVSTRPAELTTLEALSAGITEPTLICGEIKNEERRVLGRKYKNVILASPAQSVRRPAMLAELAWERWQAGAGEIPPGLAPTYLQTDQAIPA